VSNGHCLIRFARVTQSAQFVQAKAAENPGLALARFVPIHPAMLSKGTTWPPKTPARARVSSGPTPPKGTDGREGGRSPSESTAAATGDNRSNESHWESVIDRATD
jgi:hypothetical protein